jgi:molybdate transport system substrate-binding protein
MINVLVAMVAALVAVLVFTGSAQAATLSVAVAANMQFVFDEIKAEFQKDTGHTLDVTVASSGKIVTQITHGAPFDVFLSADMAYPDYLYQRGFGANEPKVYAYGSLVLWTTKKIDLSQWKKLIREGQVDKIAIANPDTAPYGKEAIKVLRFEKLENSVQSHLVFGESIAQTNQYIYSGAVDFGFTAKSVVLSKAMQGQGSWIDIPKESYQAIAQGALILKHGKEQNAALSQQFFDYLYAEKTRAILKRSGYILP